MSVLPKKTYSRAAKNKAKSVVDYDFDDEEDKENSSLADVTVKEKEKTGFDDLLASPMKQEVSFVPLKSFWKHKVNELVSKKKEKHLQKKYQLYELSDSDSDSFTLNKRKKKKPRVKVKGQKKQPGFQYNFSKQLARKKVVKNAEDEREKAKAERMNEGLRIRERLRLVRVEEELEGSFVLVNKDAFGLTSTPGRKQRANLVGMSNFNFLSPISTSSGHTDQTISSGTMLHATSLDDSLQRCAISDSSDFFGFGADKSIIHGLQDVVQKLEISLEMDDVLVLPLTLPTFTSESDENILQCTDLTNEDKTFVSPLSNSVKPACTSANGQLAPQEEPSCYYSEINEKHFACPDRSSKCDSDLEKSATTEEQSELQDRSSISDSDLEKSATTKKQSELKDRSSKSDSDLDESATTKKQSELKDRSSKSGSDLDESATTEEQSELKDRSSKSDSDLDESATTEEQSELQDRPSKSDSDLNESATTEERSELQDRCDSDFNESATKICFPGQKSTDVSLQNAESSKSSVSLFADTLSADSSSLTCASEDINYRQSDVADLAENYIHLNTQEENRSCVCDELLGGDEQDREVEPKQLQELFLLLHNLNLASSPTSAHLASSMIEHSDDISVPTRSKSDSCLSRLFIATPEETTYIDDETVLSEDETVVTEQGNVSVDTSHFTNITVRRGYHNWGSRISVQTTTTEQDSTLKEDSSADVTISDLLRNVTFTAEPSARRPSQYLTKVPNTSSYFKTGSDSSYASFDNTVVHVAETSLLPDHVAETHVVPVLHEPARTFEGETQVVPVVPAPARTYARTRLTKRRTRSDLEVSLDPDMSTLGCLDESRPFDELEDSRLPVPVFESTVCDARLRARTKRTQCQTIVEEDASLSPVSEACTSTKPTLRDTMFKVPWPRNRTVRQTLFEDAGDITLMGGKQWVRSLSILKQLQNGTVSLVEDSNTTRQGKGRRYQEGLEQVLHLQTSALQETVNQTLSDTARNITCRLSNLTLGGNVTLSRPTTRLLPGTKDCDNVSFVADNQSNLTLGGNVTLSGHTTKLLPGTKDCDNDDVSSFRTFVAANQSLDLSYHSKARQIVLLRCGQESPLTFEKHFNKATLPKCKKIGEGVYGEVFMFNNSTVIKIIPIEGSQLVNGEPQKRFEDVLSEIIIAMELSNLRYNTEHQTSGFSLLKRCWCVEGEYPSFLVDLWNDFDAEKGSENDTPTMFGPDQLFIVLELANGGRDLEAFTFTSAEQAHSLFVQTAFTLAVAEKALEFEHRDLHWGNILISPTDAKTVTFVLDGVEYRVPTKGVQVAIIDFTLSRISFDGCCIFNDLSVDPSLFTSQGDFQFEVYRLMRKAVEDDWALFRPKTNIFWLHYVLDKMMTLVRYKRTNTKVHLRNIDLLKSLKTVSLQFDDCSSFVMNHLK